MKIPLSPQLKLVFFNLAVLTAFTFSAQLSEAQVLFENNFDQYPQAGLYTTDQLDVDFAEPRFEDGIREGRVSLVTGANAFGGEGTTLAVAFPEGQVGTKETGAQWKSILPQAVEEATLTYRVKFSDGFDFVRGGKLPGLAGGTAPSGSTQADGFNGWAGRLMWRTFFTGEPGEPEQLTSGGISYAKHVNSGFDQDGRQEDRVFWIDDAGENVVLQSGVWYEIQQRVVMNTPSVRDGILQIWLDGQLVLDQNDLEYRKTADLQIDQLFFSTFFGGNSSGWATSQDEVIFFDDFKITGPETVTPPTEPPATEPPATEQLHVPSQFTTIQAAVDAATDGQQIMVDEGVFRETVVVNKSVEINGTKETFLVGQDRDKPTLSIQASNVTINTLDTRNGLNGIEIGANCSNVKLVRVDVRRAYHTGIQVQVDANEFSIIESTIRESKGDGIAVRRNHGAAIVDCVIIKNAGRGVFFSDATGFEVLNNQTDENGGAGIEIFGSDGNLMGNVANENKGGPGVYLQGSNNQLIGNSVTGNADIGFLLIYGTNVTFEFNTASKNGFTNLVSNGVGQSYYASNKISGAELGAIIENAWDNVVEANQVENNSIIGLYFAPSTTRNNLSGNQYRGNGFGNDVVDLGYRNETKN